MFILKDKKSHAVIVYEYIKGETMNKIKVTPEMTTDFGFFIGNLTSTLKVIVLNIFQMNKYVKFKKNYFSITFNYNILLFRNLIMKDFIEIAIYGL